MKDYSNERQIEVDLELDTGDYLVVPRCSGCTLRRPANAKNLNIKLMTRDGNLHYLAELAIKDIFRRLDKVVVNNILEYSEFQEFYAKFNSNITELDFKQKILKRFSSN